MKNIIIALVSIFLGSVGQVLLKVGMSKVGKITLQQLTDKLFIISTTPSILIGMCCFVISSILWLVVISQTQLSNAYPMVSLGYVFVFIMSILLFQETVNFPKLAGLTVIVIGVIIMGKG
ncbi:EamA family transporter [Paenibacillus harenae]|uniref:EamA family transporter n=1 Tax=Paenibacillus harenae TaxID=306543 RepID=UPI00055BAB7D|nr:EamA family transporter [Paenibacillus harenae]